MTKTQLENLKALYPKHTKVQLVHMRDEYAPPEGTIGYVTNVDDMGTIFKLKMLKNRRKLWCPRSDLNRYGLFNRGILSPLHIKPRPAILPEFKPKWLKTTPF